MVVVLDGLHEQSEGVGGKIHVVPIYSGEPIQGKTAECKRRKSGTVAPAHRYLALAEHGVENGVDRRRLRDVRVEAGGECRAAILRAAEACQGDEPHVGLR